MNVVVEGRFQTLNIQKMTCKQATLTQYHCYLLSRQSNQNEMAPAANSWWHNQN